MKIGIDLDNTLIFYDDAFVLAAKERGLLPAGFHGGKQQLRDHLRAQEGGEEQWQALQGYVYGAGISKAALFPGVQEFLRASRGHELFILSHKTEFGHFDEGRVNLRDAARQFLAAQGMFAHVPQQHVKFFAARADKVAAIAALAPDWFIDDLPEVFAEPGFPASAGKILFYPAPAAPQGPWTACKSWQEISNLLFRA